MRARASHPLACSEVAPWCDTIPQIRRPSAIAGFNSPLFAAGNKLSVITAPTSIKGVLLVNGQVVLVHNARDEWELPGGRAEPGENHARTLAREFAEELAINVRPDAQIDSYLFEVIPGRHVFIVTYGCTLVGEFRPAISDEHTDYCLWPVDRLAELKLPLGYKRSIETWANTT